MHAIVQHEFGGPEVLRYEERQELVPPEGHVRIAVGAAGVHLLDTSIRAGTGFGALPRPELPMVPGREVAGVVDAAGPGAGEWVGRRVVAHLGQASGGYAEQALASASSLHTIPDPLTCPAAVAAIGTGRTATGILDQLRLGSGDVVLIPSAAGGLGSLLVQAGRNAGAYVVGLAGGEAKAGLVRQLGADVVIDYRAAGWQEALHAVGRPPTVVYDGVGGEVGRLAFDLLAEGGTQLVFGWTGGEGNRYEHPAKTAVQVLGPALTAREGGLRSLEAEALAAAADGSRRPLVHPAFRLAEAAEAHRALAARETYGKVVLQPDAAWHKEGAQP